MTTSSTTLRTALAASLTNAREKCQALEYHDLSHLHRGGQLPLGEANPFVREFVALVERVVEEDPRWCADCVHVGASCGGGCGGAFWGPDWGSIRAAVFNAEAKALGIECRSFGLVCVPTVEFFSHPRTPGEVLTVLREHLDWSYQDFDRGHDPDGDGYEAASKAASAFEAEYAARL